MSPRRWAVLAVLAYGGGAAMSEAEPQPPLGAESCPSAERHLVQTEDGATIALHHHPGDGPPVLIVHGISSNHRCWDLSPERSVATALVAAGFDPWLLDLRGHGDALTDAQGRRQWGGWTMDDYGQHDVPAAVAYVLAQTGKAKIGYVGHSLGGMIGAVYASTVPGAQDKLYALIAVGSPLDFSDPDPLVSGALGLARWSLPVVPTDQLAKIQAAMGLRSNPINALVDAALLNDVAPELRPMMYRAISSPMTGGELRQLGAAAQEGGFVDAQGLIDYRGPLAQVTVPTLVIAGRADQIAPVDRVMAFYTAVGAKERRLVIAGRATGFAVDYGHLDLTLGDHAATEIFPLIAEWLRR